MPLDHSRPAFPLLQTSSEENKKILDDVSVFTRLSKVGLGIFPITIEEEIKELAVARLLISKTFGGNTVQAFPDIGEESLEGHGFDNFMCISLVSTQKTAKVVTSEYSRAPHFLSDSVLLPRPFIHTPLRYRGRQVYGWTASSARSGLPRTCGWWCELRPSPRPSGNIWGSTISSPAIHCLSKSGRCSLSWCVCLTLLPALSIVTDTFKDQERVGGKHT